METNKPEQRFRSFDDYDSWLNQFIGYGRKTFLETYDQE